MPDESAKIILAATHGKLSKVRDTLAIEGTINTLKCEFQFRTSDWDNTVKTAVFVRGRIIPSTSNEDITHVILDENNQCDVPAEMLVENGFFSVGVFGSKENYRMVSNWMYYCVVDGCYADGSTPSDITPSVYEQILIALQNKSDVTHNHNNEYYTKSEIDNKYFPDIDLSNMVTKDDLSRHTDNMIAILTSDTDVKTIKTLNDAKTYADDLNASMSERVEAIEDDMANFYYTKYEVDDNFMLYYTKAEINNMLNIANNGTSLLDAGSIVES